MNIIETIRTHKLIVLASALGLLIIMLIISVIILLSGTKKPSIDPDEVMISIDPMIFMLPDEPLELPPPEPPRPPRLPPPPLLLSGSYVFPPASFTA